MPTTKLKLQSRSKALQVRNFMSRSPHSIGKDQPLAVAHQLMRDHDLRHLPVLEHGKLAGIISQRDLYFLESIAGVNADTERVEEGMSPDVYCVPPETPLAAVVSDMAIHKYGCAVVMDGPKVVGVFTTTDALAAFAEHLGRAD